jgi:anti-repressor protein
MDDKDFNELVQTEVEKRLSDPVTLRESLLRLSEKVKSLEKEIETIIPMKKFYVAVTESDDWMEMAAAVKVLAAKGFGRNKVFELLRERSILRYNNEPYQQYVERGYFKTIEQVFTIADSAEVMINRKTMVSQKGLDFIRKIINEESK